MKMLTSEVRSMTTLGRMLLLLLLIACWGCDGNRSRFIPDNLVGVWRTDDPRYRGRSLELAKDSAVIGTGTDKPSIELIDSVTIRPASEETTYSIQCRTADGTRHLLTLSFRANGDGEVRLLHPQNIVWKRRLDPDLPSRGKASPKYHRTQIVPKPLYEIDCVTRGCSGDW